MSRTIQLMRWLSKIGVASLATSILGCGIGLGLFPPSSEEALHPKQEIEYWIKVSNHNAERVADWVTCGGQPMGFYGYWPRLPNETYEQSHFRQDVEFQRCLIRKGYRHINDDPEAGICRHPEMKSMPVCGAP